MEGRLTVVSSRSVLMCLLLMALAGSARAQQAVYPSARHGGNYLHNYYIPPAPSSTPWAPCWSPDGRWVAAAMHGSIWRVDHRTGRAEELTYNDKYHSSPDWSPDGKWIVYTADDGGTTIQLEVLNLETGRSHPLTDDRFVYADPVFSPDGTHLAYVSTSPNGYFNVYVRAIRDGRWVGPEVAVSRDNSFGRDRLYFGPWDMHIQPAWMPGGKELLLVSNRNVPLGSGDVWRVPVEAGGMDRGRVILSEQTLYRTRPDVSPDGKRFVYSSSGGAADIYNHLYVLPTEGGWPYKLTFGDRDDFHPRWSPDGEWIAYISNEGGLPQLWLLETYGGKRRQVEIAERVWRRPMGKLLVRVLDAETGKTTPSRIYGLAPDGKFYAPPNAYSRISQENHRHLFHATGEFRVEVPPGEMTLEAVKGFEYWPASQNVEVKAGQVTEVVLRLSRMAGFRARGWYSGSTHVHMNYGGNLNNTLENLILMSRAEDQAVVNHLVANKDNRILDWQYFVPGGGEHPVSRNDPDLIVIVGEEYRPPFYGHVYFIGLRSHLISPFTTGYEGTAIESLYPSNTDMFRKALAQGATVGYVHPFSGDADPLEANLGVAKGLPVDAALGVIHGLEWSRANRAGLRVWHHLLNNDLPVAPVGGEDAISDLHRARLVGSVRTYAFLGEGFSAEAWIEALRQGKTFFSSGPLLEFQIEDRIPGGSVRLRAGGGSVRVKARMWSIVPLSRVVIYRNGQVWRELPLAEDGRSASLEEEVEIVESGWFSLTAEGDAAPVIDSNYPQAATNAIRVYVGDQKIRSRASAAYFIRWIDRLQGMAESWFGWRSRREKDRVFAQFEEARDVYRRLAAETEGP